MSTHPTPARRKPPEQRRLEILHAASQVAVADGLDSVTARRVADALGVYPGLINHYFRTADELVAAAFVHAATAEREEVFTDAGLGATPTEQIQRLLASWLQPHRDAVSLLWLDAWQASRRRETLLDAVTDQMNRDVDHLEPIISAGMAGGEFHVDDARAAAMRLMALVDGLSIQAAIRTTLDYTVVEDMLTIHAAATLGTTGAALTVASPGVTAGG